MELHKTVYELVDTGRIELDHPSQNSAMQSVTSAYRMGLKGPPTYKFQGVSYLVDRRITPGRNPKFVLHLHRVEGSNSVPAY